MKNFVIKISGPAGMGIIQAGEIFSKALNKLGFYTLVYPEYPSRIRGGDNHIQVIFSFQPVNSPYEKIDLLLAFNKSCLESHRKEVKKDGQVFEYEKLDIKAEEDLVKNSAALGFLWKVLGFPLAVLQEQLRQEFKDDKDVLELNIKATGKGYKKGIKIGARSMKGEGKGKAGLKKIVNLSGNEALVAGILAGRCGFAAIYPMTPINSILTLLAKEKKVIVFRPEDEIAGICSATGASYAGKRAMVATSGGGFSLMVEGLGMAGMAETPLVIVLGQRTGPSSGIPTYSSQADLKFVISAGQGEFPRIVLTPGDLKELYWLGMEAFNLAEIYQVPVILMTDKYLAESRFSLEEEELKSPKTSEELKKITKLENYMRYKITKNGISPRAFPGQAPFLTNSYEHDEFGFSIEDADTRKKMMEKRMKKLKSLKGGFELYGIKGLGGTRGTLVSWGSTKGILLDYLKDHQEYNLLHFWRVWPFPQEAISILKKAKKIICVEGNYSGQMAEIIELKTGLKVGRILKDDGRPFFKEEIERLISNV